MEEYINKQFVTPEIALSLKKVGFNELCFGWIAADGFLSYGIREYTNSVIAPEHAAAPLWQQALDWLETKNVLVDIGYVKQLRSYHFTIERRSDGLHLVRFLDYPNHPTRYSALVMGITEALKLLEHPETVELLKRI